MPTNADAQSTDYARMKKKIEDETGLSFSMEASVVSQMGAPGGTVNAVQAMFTPNVNWKALKHPVLGAGSFQFGYLAAQYWSAASAAELASDLALNTPLNTYPANVRFFRRLSYTAGCETLNGQAWGLFLRANTAWNSSFAVQSSTGAVLNDPLGRESADQSGLGVAWNRTNASLWPSSSPRPSETMLEIYWNWALGRQLLVTPDIQLFLQPVLAQTSVWRPYFRCESPSCSDERSACAAL